MEGEVSIDPPFPPRDGIDVAAYDTDEVVAGYRESRPDDPEPGDNRSPAYRWGWQNRKRDSLRHDDGFDFARRAYFDLRRRAH
jgi:hypothetical protein